MKVGLYFGSFNPPHVGHGIIGEFALEAMQADEIWYIISPQNPFKERAELLDEQSRYELVEKALKANPRLKASDVEFDMPRPSYTIDTVRRLLQTNPNSEFFLILGSDNLPGLPRWKEAKELTELLPIAIYERPGYPVEASIPDMKIQQIDAPMLDISSTRIRAAISDKRDCAMMMQHSVWQQIKEKGHYH